MKATVMTTGPGVIMARPLPNTNKLDFRKKRNNEPVVLRMPGLNEMRVGGRNELADRCRRHAEKSVLAIVTNNPPPRKNQTISFSVIAVESPSTRKTAHKSLSFLIDVLINLIAERATIAITAAPIP